MASLGSDQGKRGTSFRVLLSTPGGRHTIRLGNVSRRIAETARRMIESLQSAKAAGHSPDPETAEWVGRVSDEIHRRLERAGLVPPRVEAEPARVTLGAHLDQVFADLGPRKKNTLISYERSRRLLERFFTRERMVESITEADADAFKRWLLGKWAPASASVDLRRARYFLKVAVRRRLIQANPFSDVACGPQDNQERIVYVPAEVVERVIAVCPDNDWRLVFALPRYAGVRFPSEVRELKWSDIDWENSRFTVRQRKLEHHPGRATRVVPIFAALRPHLERAFKERKPDAVYVLPRARWTGELSTHAKRLLKKAGVIPWPRLFNNMRGSCSDDLQRAGVSEKAVSAWIGNTPKIRERHYHAVRDEDWAAATGGPKQAAQIPAQSGAVSSHQEPSAPRQTRKKPLHVLKTEKTEYPRQGSNLQPSAPEADALSN
jgi:integrase